MGLTKKIAIGVTFVVITNYVPAVLLGVLGYGYLAGSTLLATMTGTIAGLSGGFGVSSLVSVVLGVGGGCAVWSTGSPIGATALFVALSILAGIFAAKGHAGSYLLAPIAIAFALAAPPTNSDGKLTSPLVFGIGMIACALWSSAISSVVRHRLKLPEPPPVSVSRAVAYGAALALMTGIAAYFLVKLDLGHSGAWWITTIFVCFEPYMQDAIQRTLERSFGTIVGFIIAMIAAFLFGSYSWVIVLLGVAFMVLSVIARVQSDRPYWQYAAMITPTVVLLEGVGSSVTGVAYARLGYTLLGAVMAIVLEIAVLPAYQRSAQLHGLTRF